MKKLIATLSAAVMLLGAAAGLSACGGTTPCAHNYEEDTAKRVAATCHSDGTKYLVCSECGDEKTEAITQRPAHTFTGELVSVDDETHARKCSVTGCTAVDSETAPHVWGEETKVTNESFYHEGLSEKECECGAKYEIRIPALDSIGVSLDDENWKFGTAKITNFDTCEHTLNELTEKNGDGSGYTDGKSEIKPDWFLNEDFDTNVILYYTFEEDVYASVVATFEGVGASGGALSDYSLRIGLKDGNAVKDANFKRGTNFTTDPYVREFKKGDTIVFVFNHETDGFDQGHYSITISKANPVDNAE